MPPTHPLAQLGVCPHLPFPRQPGHQSLYHHQACLNEGLGNGFFLSSFCQKISKEKRDRVVALVSGNKTEAKFSGLSLRPEAQQGRKKGMSPRAPSPKSLSQLML